MKRVLILSGSNAFLLRMSPKLRASEDFEVIIVTDGYQAAEALIAHQNSLLLTDANIPRKGCLEIIAHLSRQDASVPVIAMPDIGKPWFYHRLGQRELLYYLMTPGSGRSLSDAIEVGFDICKDGSSYRGLTVGSLLPLVEVERKTGRMTIRSQQEGKGYLYLREGVLIDAHYDDLGGEQAARKLASWDRIAIDFSDLPKRRSRIKVASNLMELAGASWVKQDVGGGAKTAAEGDDRCLEILGGLKSIKAAAAALLDKYVDDFRFIKGFLGMAITDSRGMLLASDGVGQKRLLKDAVDDASKFLSSISYLTRHETARQMTAFTLHTRIGTVFVATSRIQGIPCRLIALTRAGTSSAFATIHLQNIFLRMMMDPGN
jgi:hypothetical protein